MLCKIEVINGQILMNVLFEQFFFDKCFSMAHGVENSWAVICFLTQAYQNSKNCQAELTYAKEQGKNIIPVYMESNWKPSGWLGIILAGDLYIKRESSDLQ